MELQTAYTQARAYASKRRIIADAKAEGPDALRDLEQEFSERVSCATQAGMSSVYTHAQRIYHYTLILNAYIL